MLPHSRNTSIKVSCLRGGCGKAVDDEIVTTAGATSLTVHCSPLSTTGTSVYIWVQKLGLLRYL